MTTPIRELRVRDVMTPDVETLSPTDDVDIADMVMRLDRLHHLPVVEDGTILGVVSQRDVARYQTSPARDLPPEARRRAMLRVKIRDMMSGPARTIDAEAPIAQAAKLMQAHYLGCLPVTHDGELVGIVTGTDLMRVLILCLEEG